MRTHAAGFAGWPAFPITALGSNRNRGRSPKAAGPNEGPD